MKRLFWAVMALLAVMSVALAHAGPPATTTTDISYNMDIVIGGADLGPVSTTAPAPPDIGRAGSNDLNVTSYNVRGAPTMAALGTNYTDDSRPRIRIYAGDSQRR